jgi:hypothetical protein
LADWTKERFNLPPADILDLSHERDPGGAASRGGHLALIKVPEAQVDRLAYEGYLDGDNTLGQAIEAFLADHLAALAGTK